MIISTDVHNVVCIGGWYSNYRNLNCVFCKYVVDSLHCPTVPLNSMTCRIYERFCDPNNMEVQQCLE
jgi:hypothetical protein